MAEPKPQSRRHCMGQRGAPISCGLPVSQGCLYWSGREPVGRRHPSFARHSSSSPQARASHPRQEASPKIISSQKVGGRDPIRTGTSALGNGWGSAGLSYAPTDRPLSKCPHCPPFITFTNNKPSEGSIDTPPQFPPPSVLGKNNALPSSGSGVYGSPIFIRFASNNSLQNRACSGDRSYMS